ncbi:SOS response-associated peptidase [Paenibacillus terrigena]|uniref:SOS response-associated peptidase n=1 Tax=Paenibacillus terrigena TaxID=369333 RepID=UPI0003613576|nr:SOS response-associated peptidase [Paenibacillus terrigena]
MCGRYTITMTFDELVVRYFIEEVNDPFYLPRYNVAPMQIVPAIINDGSRNRLGPLRWGLVPNWAKDQRKAGGMINAKAETLLEKPSYRNLVYRKRCIIPADSFYEWKAFGSKKQPMRFMRRDEGIFSMAALYDSWVNPEDGEKISTFSIITTTPNSLVSDVHDRMPVILRKEDEAYWLDRHQSNPDKLLTLLKPFPESEMMRYAVSSTVGSVKNDGPECVAKVEELKVTEESEQPYLF